MMSFVGSGSCPSSVDPIDIVFGHESFHGFYVVRVEARAVPCAAEGLFTNYYTAVVIKNRLIVNE